MGHIFRAIVMLACLAVVPVVAMYGKQIQEFGRAVLATYQARVQTKTAVAPAPAGGTATLQSAPPAAGSDPMLSASPWTDNPSAREPSPLPPIPGQAGPAQQPSADNRLPSELAREMAGGVQQASFSDAAGTNRTATNPSPTQPAAVGNSPWGPPSPDVPAGSSTSGAPSTAQFRRIEQRLRELGATYYLLETWGPGGDRYRFFCRMALAGNSDNGRNRIFQATDSDPLRAMQNVLEQAEQWRNGRQP